MAGEMSRGEFLERVENRIRLMEIHGVDPHDCYWNALDVMDAFITRHKARLRLRDEVETSREVEVDDGA